MSTIQAQLEFEQAMVQHGVDRYRAQQDSAVTGGRTTDTSAGGKLLKAYVIQISDHLRLYLDGKHPEGRRRGKYAKLLDALDTDKSAMLTLKAVIATLYTPQTLQSLCISIGKVVEDDLRFMRFQTEHTEYYAEIIRQFEARGSTHYNYQRTSLVHAERAKDADAWTPWHKEDHFGVGALLVSILMEVCDLVEQVTIKKPRGRVEVIVAPTAECIKWVMNHNEGMEIANPDRMPCIVPPADWVGLTEGGYYSPAIRGRTPFIKMRMSRTGNEQRTIYKDADLSKVFRAVNAMQRTSWKVNADVFSTMRACWHGNLAIGMPRSQPIEIPACPLAEGLDARTLTEGDPAHSAFLNWKLEARELHGLEKDRIAKNLSLSRTMRIATNMREHSEFYFVYQCDFRGRVYSATAGLSPQGTDHAKALLTFAKGKALGERGMYWLKVHGANKYGKDKVSYDDRVAWIDQHSEQWCAVADDPIANKDYWKDADKPWQFLAFCFEYRDMWKQGPSYVSHLPVALDGSCNGLQHFSAMLRDSVGGAAVNLIPSPTPSDIYQEVADVCTRKLIGLRSTNDERHGGAANWLEVYASLGSTGMPRKLSKPPVMTLPYGSTRQACTASIFKWVHSEVPTAFEKGTTFRHAMYLSPLLWSSISEVVIAARAAMDWIQDCATVLSKAGHPLQYTSPLGFPVYQASYNYTTRCIETQIGGRLRLRIAEDTDTLSSRKQRQGSSPNLIHTTDACHMQMCLLAGEDVGIDSFAMIHDDFGTHACHIDMWHTIIRTEFVNLHTDHDILADFKKVHECRHDLVLPALPARGNLDLRTVLNSKYFFG